MTDSIMLYAVPPPVFTHVQIKHIKRLNGQFAWSILIDAFQGDDNIGSTGHKSGSVQAVMDWLRAWHTENDVPAKTCKLIPAIERIGHFGPSVNCNYIRAINITDIFSDDDFVLAHLSMNHD